MSLFQKSVLSKYLKSIDEDALTTQWQLFKQHFHNPTIQQNIRNSKEEQYQEGFLDDLFVKVLGYTKNPEPDFNLTTELKNISNAKKTDGAIIINNKTIAVIELKGTNTTDLSKVEAQAFNYKNNQPDAVYVITSNFEKLRFYIDNAVDFLEFNLFQLTEEDFKLMCLCLAHQNLSKGLPQQIKNESLFNEENITKKLYKDYSTFKNELFTSIQKDNPQYDKLTLYKKTQKLLDRFLFIFFAEDRLLLPPNSIRAILKQWEQLKDLDAYTPLYSRYKKYFGYMNTGHKGKQHDIFAYNGGLFAADEILDNITIADEVLATHTQNLSHYDFESEVSVNILGHIFEHSLNEIEAITAELEGKAIDTKKTKRKKDGVFYTPKYITKYIVENTVGKLCTEKKTELQIEEADYAKERKGRKKETLKKLQQQLEAYRNWLLSLTICDPACGSGAFLNQALEFLITEHRYIDELQAKLLNEPMVFSDIENAILENNLFGVDINEESVDIAKLSLWLRTAQKGRKLTTLSSNIKCGNSLIDDPAVAGAKAFNWQTEFPQVFEPIDKQAFHVVLTTHNSRTSQRMIDFNIKTGTPIELNVEQEIELTKIIGNIINEHDYHCLAYNVCKDHVHLILVCQAEELVRQVQKIKAISSKLFKRNTSKEHASSHENPSEEKPMEHVPLESEEKPMEHVSLESEDNAPLESGKGTHRKGDKKYTPLWSQKFYRANLDVWELNTGAAKGYQYGDTYIDNAMAYIKNNRVKHQLPPSPKLEALINGFVTSPEKAFEQEYGGGFNVVIGNPPYGAYLKQEDKKFLSSEFETFQGNFEIYFFFIELLVKLLNERGISGYITPDTWINIPQAQKLREYVLTNLGVLNIVTFSYPVFEDASVNAILFILDKHSKVTKCRIIHSKDKSKGLSINNDTTMETNIKLWEKSEDKQFQVWQTNEDIDIINKINHNSFNGSEFLDVSQGIVPYSTEHLSKEEIKNRIYHCKTKIGNEWGEWLQGRAISRYSINKSNKQYLKYGDWLHRSRKPKYFVGSRILIQEITGGKPPRISATIYSELLYHDPGIISCINKSKISTEFLLSIINSKLISWFIIKTSPKGKRTTFPKVLIGDIRKLPIKKCDGDYIDKITGLVNMISKQSMSLQDQSNSFLLLIKSKYNLDTISKKLHLWDLLDFSEFLKELEKCRKKAAKENVQDYIKLSLAEEAEWMQYFNEQKAKATELQNQINQTDTEIDQMVYQLYGLTDEEIKIVEASV